MTEDDFPAGLGRHVEASAASPLDDGDAELLAELGDLLTAADPVPADLVERIRFSLALDEVYAEVSDITRLETDALAVRGEDAAGMRTESLTFTAERLSAMVTVTRLGPEQVRVDGWIAPEAPMRVHLRMQEGSEEVLADASGRFVFEGLPEGFAQLSFHPLPPDPADPGDPAGSGGGAVVTPLFQL